MSPVVVIKVPEKSESMVPRQVAGVTHHIPSGEKVSIAHNFPEEFFYNGIYDNIFPSKGVPLLKASSLRDPQTVNKGDPLMYETL